MVDDGIWNYERTLWIRLVDLFGFYWIRTVSLIDMKKLKYFWILFIIEMFRKFRSRDWKIVIFDSNKNERRSKESCPKGMIDQDMGNGGLLTIHVFFLD